jgi:hypothetical protein
LLGLVDVHRCSDDSHRWVLLHLVAHPEGLPQDTLSAFARASMAATLRLHGGGGNVGGGSGGTVEAGGPGAPGRLVVLAHAGGGGGGASTIILDAESLALLPSVDATPTPPPLMGTGRGTGRGARGLAAAAAAATSATSATAEVDNCEDGGGSGGGGVRPVPGVVWASDAEVEGLLGALAPFMRRILASQAGDDGSDGDGRRLALAHSSLAAAALFRYDRLDPGARPAVQLPAATAEEEGEALPYRR